MTTMIRRFLESKGFKTISFDKEMCHFTKVDESTVVDIIWFSESEYNINIKSLVKDFSLAHGMKFNTMQPDKVNRLVTGVDIINSFYICKNRFKQEIMKHLENIESIKNIFL